MTNAMSNAILEYAKLAGQLDSKTNQMNKSSTANLIKQQNNANRRKREFTSIDDSEMKGNLDSKLVKSIDNGFIKFNDVTIKLDTNKKQFDNDQNDNLITIKEKKVNSENKEKQVNELDKQQNQVERDIGKLSEQMDNLESDLKLENVGIENEIIQDGENSMDDCDLQDEEAKSQNNDPQNDDLQNDALENGDLQNGDLDDEYRTKLDDEEKDNQNKNEEQNFKSFYNTNYLNDKHNRLNKYSRSNAKRMLIRNRVKDNKNDSTDYSSTSSSNNNRTSSSSNSPNDTSLNGNSDNTTALLSSTTAASSSNGNGSPFEDNLADENRCSSTTSINSISNNRLNLIGKF